MFLILAGKVDSGFRNERSEAGDEVQGLEAHMGGAIAPRGFECIVDVAVFGERQAFFRHRRSGDVATQAFELVAFAGFRRNPGMQGEASDVTYAGSERFINCGQRLQGQHLATVAGTGGDTRPCAVPRSWGRNLGACS